MEMRFMTFCARQSYRMITDSPPVAGDRVQLFAALEKYSLDARAVTSGQATH
jgi:hypothetical protein